MATFEQSFSIDKSDPKQLANNEVIYVNNLTITAVTNNVLQLQGVVYSGSTQQPINGATIVVYNPNNEAVATDESREIGTQAGAFLIVFNGTYGQIYGVTAELQGYDSVNQNIAFSSGETSILNFTLPLSTVQNTIYGKVTDTQNNPIANASVVVWTEDTTISVRTGEDGAYIATGDFKSGEQRVITVSKFGYIGKTTPITFPTTNALEENFSLQIDPLVNYTTITGQVVSQSGSLVMGVPGAFVGLYQIDTTVTPQRETLITSMLTDAYGYYAFTNIPSGYSYVVRSTKIDEQTSS